MAPGHPGELTAVLKRAMTRPLIWPEACTDADVCRIQEHPAVCITAKVSQRAGSPDSDRDESASRVQMSTSGESIQYWYRTRWQDRHVGVIRGRQSGHHRIQEH